MITFFSSQSARFQKWLHRTIWRENMQRDNATIKKNGLGALGICDGKRLKKVHTMQCVDKTPAEHFHQTHCRWM